MVRVVPTKMRAQVLDSANGLEVLIPAKRNPFILAFLLFWLGGWVMGEGFALHQLFSPQHSATDLFLVFWLGAWTLGGAFVVYTVLWSLFGREHVILRRDALVIRRELLSMGRSREYDLPQVRALRVSPSPYNPFDFKSSLQFWGIGGGLIAFDYGASTIRFGASIQEGEAAQIVQRLAARYRFAATPPAA